MKLSNFHFQIGQHTISGIWATIFIFLIALPILAFIGILLSVIFSIMGVIITLILGIAITITIIRLIAYILPEKWRHRLSSFIPFNHLSKKKLKPNTTPDGKPIIDVDFKEDSNP